MEWSILHALNDFLYRHDSVEDPLLFYINISEALFVVTLVLVFVFANGERRRSWRQAATAAVLSAGLALLAAKVISELVDRARPFVVDPNGVHLFSGHAADPGFPSDHSTGAFAVAMAIYLRKRSWGVVALFAAALLAIARVAIGVHFPSDVVAGAMLGCVTALALWIERIRGWIDALADRLGGRIERALGGEPPVLVSDLEAKGAPANVDAPALARSEGVSHDQLATRHGGTRGGRLDGPCRRDRLAPGPPALRLDLVSGAGGRAHRRASGTPLGHGVAAAYRLARVWP